MPAALAPFTLEPVQAPLRAERAPPTCHRVAMAPPTEQRENSGHAPQTGVTSDLGEGVLLQPRWARALLCGVCEVLSSFHVEGSSAFSTPWLCR